MWTSSSSSLHVAVLVHRRPATALRPLSDPSCCGVNGSSCWVVSSAGSLAARFVSHLEVLFFPSQHLAKSAPVVPTWPALDPTCAARITWNIGDIVECQHGDYEGNPREHSVSLVDSAAPDGGFNANLIRIQDPTMRESNGHGNPGIHSPASKTSTDLSSTYGAPPIQPIGAWRKTGTVHDFDIREVPWLRRPATAGWHAAFSAAVKAWMNVRLVALARPLSLRQVSRRTVVL